MLLCKREKLGREGAGEGGGGGAVNIIGRSTAYGFQHVCAEGVQGGLHFGVKRGAWGGLHRGVPKTLI